MTQSGDVVSIDRFVAYKQHSDQVWLSSARACDFIYRASKDLNIPVALGRIHTLFVPIGSGQPGAALQMFEWLPEPDPILHMPVVRLTTNVVIVPVAVCLAFF